MFTVKVFALVKIILVVEVYEILNFIEIQNCTSQWDWNKIEKICSEKKTSKLVVQILNLQCSKLASFQVCIRPKLFYVTKTK